MKKFLSVLLCAAMLLSFAGCTGNLSKGKYTPVSGLDTDTNATVTIAIPYETNKALNTVANDFMAKYPNVNVELKYIEDYDTNAVKLFQENSLDIIFQKDCSYTEYTEKDETTGEKIPTGKTTDDYYYNLYDDTEIDFSETTSDITNNYRHTRTDASGAEITYQYCYPLGGETRGVFVNKSLLDTYNLKVPTNYKEFLNCCEVIKASGLVPIQGGGDTAAYGLGMAPAANAIVHNETALEAMKNAEPGVSEYFKDTLSKIYTLSTSRYFDYKAVEKTGFFISTNELGQCESFLGLKTDKTTFEVTKPENNIGYVAFMPYISSTQAVIQSLIDEYALSTEFVFICSPLNDEGTTSPAYITPYYGICVNKNSENLIWAREFVNFIFHAENNKTYAENASIIPNTADALEYTAKKYNLDVNKDITLCGQICFSDKYNGYTPIAATLKEVMKCSASKYMVELKTDADGNLVYQTDDSGKEFMYMGNGETAVLKEYIGPEDSAMPGFAFCTEDYYVNYLEKQISKYRAG